MEYRTIQFIESLSELESRDKIVEKVIDEVYTYKQSLQDRGYRFTTGEHTDYLVGGQRIRSRDLEDITYLDEIAHIKRGITSEWVSRLDDLERFDEIKHQVDDILFKFD
jgi:hypothetical protein